MTLNGYDISAYQGALDPAAVPADFCIIKITGGDGYVNPNWRTQFDAARAAGKLVGVYHFARDGFTNATAHSEAQWFLQHALPILDGTVVAYLDWEGDNVGDVGYAKAWLDEVTAATGVKPLLYASYATVEAYDWSSVAGADYGLWESAYVLGYQQINGYNPPIGRAPIPYWNTIAEWQYTSVGHLPGWPNDLDLDIFYGDASTWAAYAAKNGTIQPAAGGITPTPITPAPEDDMSYSQWSQDDKDALLKDVYNAVWNGGSGFPLIQNYRLGRGEWPATIIGANEGRIQNEILPQALAGIKATIDPAALAAAIPADIAAEVAAELGKRLQTPPPAAS